MRPPRNIRVNGNREDKLVVLAVEIVKVITPDILDVSRVHETVAIGRLLDEQHRGEIVNVPVGRDFHETGLFALDQRLHPFFRCPFVVDLGPCVAGTEVVGLAVLVAHAVVVFDSVVEEQLCAFLAGFPPSLSSQKGIIIYHFCSGWRNLTMEQHFPEAACQ